MKTNLHVWYYDNKMQNYDKKKCWHTGRKEGYVSAVTCKDKRTGVIIFFGPSILNWIHIDFDSVEFPCTMMMIDDKLEYWYGVILLQLFFFFLSYHLKLAKSTKWHWLTSIYQFSLYLKLETKWKTVISRCNWYCFLLKGTQKHLGKQTFPLPLISHNIL